MLAPIMIDIERERTIAVEVAHVRLDHAADALERGKGAGEAVLRRHDRWGVKGVGQVVPPPSASEMETMQPVRPATRDVDVEPGAVDEGVVDGAGVDLEIAPSDLVADAERGMHPPADNDGLVEPGVAVRFRRPPEVEPEVTLHLRRVVGPSPRAGHDLVELVRVLGAVLDVHDLTVLGP